MGDRPITCFDKELLDGRIMEVVARLRQIELASAKYDPEDQAGALYRCLQRQKAQAKELAELVKKWFPYMDEEDKGEGVT